MKYVLLSDCQFLSSSISSRSDDMLKTSINKLKYIIKIAKGNPILQAGDFTNTPRDFVLLYHLVKLFKKEKPNLYLVRGQHDHYYRSNKPSVVSVLNKLGYLKILNKTPIKINGDKIYGSGYLDEMTYPEPNKSGKNILVCHKSISNKAAYPGHQYTEANKFLKEYKFDLILCGDIHQPFILSRWGRHCINTGPIVRTKIDESEFSPSYYIYDSKLMTTIQKGQIPHKQPFLIEAKEREGNLNKLINKFSKAIRTDNIKEINAVEILNQIIEKNKNRIDKQTIKAIGEIKNDS